MTPNRSNSRSSRGYCFHGPHQLAFWQNYLKGEIKQHYYCALLWLGLLPSRIPSCAPTGVATFKSDYKVIYATTKVNCDTSVKTSKLEKHLRLSLVRKMESNKEM